MELNQATRERNDLSNQLTVLGRKRDALNEELMRIKQKLEQSTETNGRINRNLEEMIKEIEAKQVRSGFVPLFLFYDKCFQCTIDSMEKEIQRLQELLAASRSEKEALEGVLFDAQTNLESAEDKKMQLEKEQQDLLVKHEQLKAHAAKLAKELERAEKKCQDIKSTMTHAAGNKDIEFKQALDKLRQQNEDNNKKLNHEKETIRETLEKKLQQSLQQLGDEKDGEIQQLLDRIENLQHHIENLCQQHEELMLRAENDKQQALLIGEIEIVKLEKFL